MPDSFTAHQKIHSLATLVRQRHTTGEPPYVLVLGAGASLASGASATAHIIETVVQDHGGGDMSSLAWEEKLAAFYEVLDGVSVQERYLILGQHLQGAKPSPGYRHLAALVMTRYFNLILTTNFDLFLESALVEAGLRADEYAVLISGQDREEQIVKALGYTSPRVKILKLHGDLNARIFAFTPQETFQFSDHIERTVTDILNKDIIVVGHSLRDVDLNRCIRANDGALWYVSPSYPSAADFVGQAQSARDTPDHIISGELGRFDEFLAWLRLELVLPPPSGATEPRERQGLAALDEGRRQGNSSAMAASLESLAQFYALAGQKERAEMCYDRGVALLESVDDLPGAARVLRDLGTFHTGLNRPQEAIGCYRRSLDLARRAGQQGEEARSLAMLGRWW